MKKFLKTAAIYASLLVFLGSCSMGLLEKKADSGVETAVNAVQTGKVTITVPHIAPYAVKQLKVDANTGSRGLSAKPVASRAYVAADRLEFTLYQYGSQVGDVWSIDTAIHTLDGTAFSTVQDIPVGTGYTLEVRIYNNNTSLYEPVVIGSTATTFDVNFGSQNSISLACIPNPSSTVELSSGVSSGPFVLSAPWNFGATPITTGSEMWFKLTASTTETTFTATPSTETGGAKLSAMIFDSTGSYIGGSAASGNGTPITSIWSSVTGATYYIAFIDSNVDYDQASRTFSVRFEPYVQAVAATPLVLETLVTYDLSVDEVKKYSFNGVAGHTYELFWDDSFSGSQTYTCDVRVDAFHQDSSAYFTWADSAYNYPMTITPTINELITIHVLPWASGWYGTFALKVTDTSRTAAKILLITDSTADAPARTLITAAGYQDGNITSISKTSLDGTQDLTQYSAILFFDGVEYFYYMPPAGQAALAAYVTQGGKLLYTSWVPFGAANGYVGDFATNGLLLKDWSAGYWEGSDPFTVVDVSHPITRGVTGFATPYLAFTAGGDGDSSKLKGITLVSGANTGDAVIVDDTLGTGKIVFFNWAPYYNGYDPYPIGDSGDMMKLLLTNTVNWFVTNN